MYRNGIVTVLVSGVILVSVSGCSLLKKKKPADEDPAAETADAATVSVTGIGAKNEASVLRYADETALPNEAAVIAKDGAIVRNFPGNGPQVAFLPKGTPVAKIARRFSTGILIMFDDPSSDDGSKLIGWVTPSVFDAAAPPPTKTVVVPPPTIKKDAGTPTAVVDAGGGRPVAVVDAGGGSSSGGSSSSSSGGSSSGGSSSGGSSSGTIPPPPKGAQAVPPVNGKCPDNWVIAGAVCRRKCTSEKDCDRGIPCKTLFGQKVCTST